MQAEPAPGEATTRRSACPDRPPSSERRWVRKRRIVAPPSAALPDLASVPPEWTFASGARPSRLRTFGAGDPADGCPREGREQQPPERLALEQGVALARDGVGLPPEGGHRGCVRPLAVAAFTATQLRSVPGRSRDAVLVLLGLRHHHRCGCDGADRRAPVERRGSPGSGLLVRAYYASGCGPSAGGLQRVSAIWSEHSCTHREKDGSDVATWKVRPDADGRRPGALARAGGMRRRRRR